MTHFTMGGLRTSHRVCVACRKLTHGAINAKLNKRKEADPWLSKLTTLRMKIRKEEIRRSWTTAMLRKLWISGQKLCAITGKPFDAKYAAFVAVDIDADLTPKNTVIVHRINARKRSESSFCWTYDQLERIRKSKEVYSQL